MTVVFSCPQCKTSDDFFHSDTGVRCSHCKAPAATRVECSLTPVDFAVPFGITRQLDELERLYEL